MPTTLRVAVLALLVAFTGVTAPAAVASAQESGPFSGAFDRVEDADGDGYTIDDTAALAGEGILSWLERVQWGISRSDANPFAADPPQSAAEEADEVQNYFNQHNTTLSVWLNNRTSASDSSDTVKVTWKIGGESATRYVLSNASDGNYSEVVMQKTLPDGREVDHTVTVCNYAAEQSAEELERFTEEYAETGEDVSQQYLVQMANKYRKDVESSLLSTDGDCSDAGGS